VGCSVRFNPLRTRAALTFAERPGNILTAALVTQMRTALADLQDAPHLRLLTIEGDGPDFSFGASIPEHAPEVIGRVLPDMHALVADLLHAPAPTAAIVRGRCLGGGFELALACDFIFAAETATFGLPEIALGVYPPAASVLLPLRAGHARAISAILTGDSQRAEIWRAAGLLEPLVPDADLEARVSHWFDRTLGQHSAEALRHAVRASRGPLVDAVAQRLPIAERQYLDELMQTQDAREGIRAFLAKRPPQWRDR
jgi:cyclohexa-1,5-dienecarbonyl-CoA hydratase